VPPLQVTTRSIGKRFGDKISAGNEKRLSAEFGPAKGHSILLASRSVMEGYAVARIRFLMDCGYPFQKRHSTVHRGSSEFQTTVAGSHMQAQHPSLNGIPSTGIYQTRQSPQVPVCRASKPLSTSISFVTDDLTVFEDQEAMGVSDHLRIV
jgi:hypothetical protein